MKAEHWHGQSIGQPVQGLLITKYTLRKERPPSSPSGGGSMWFSQTNSKWLAGANAANTGGPLGV